MLTHRKNYLRVKSNKISKTNIENWRLSEARGIAYQAIHQFSNYFRIIVDMLPFVNTFNTFLGALSVHTLTPLYSAI